MSKIFIDIETIPDQREGAYEEFLANVKAPGQYKKPESIQKWIDENGAAAAQEAYHKTSLAGISGEICSIAYAIDDGEVDGYIRRPGESEADLLRIFFETVLEHFPDHQQSYPRIQWVGHNILGFDLLFLKQRCWVNNVKPSIFLPTEAKHGGEYVFDTMKGWAGWKGFVSQDALAKALGLPGKGDITGADVHDYYLAERYDEILAYNKSDVETVRAIYKRLQWK